MPFILVTFVCVFDSLTLEERKKGETDCGSSFEFVGWINLFMFFFMGIVFIFLLRVMRKKKKMAQLRNGGIAYSFRKEFRSLKIILFFFELSYFFEFLWDQYFDKLLFYNYFAYLLSFDVSLYIDAVQFLVFLLFHCKNFRTSKRVPDESEGQKTEKVHFTSMNESEDDPITSNYSGSREYEGEEKLPGRLFSENSLYFQSILGAN